MYTPRIVLPIAAALGLTSVLAGAALSHVIGGNNVLDIAVRYHQIYAVLITALACVLPNSPLKAKRPACLAVWLFTIGIICFSGGLYAAFLTNIAAFNYATPVGGILLMAGWIALFIAGLRSFAKTGV